MDPSYTAIRAVNWSTLKHMRVSPRHYRHALTAPHADTTPRAMGRALHTLVLEPQNFGDQYAVYDGDRRGNAWKDFQAANEGKTILRMTEYDLVRAQADAVGTDWRRSAGAVNIEVEQVLRWTDPATGLACKGIADIVGSFGIIDLKGAGQLDVFERLAVRDGYAHQLAFYRRGLGGNLPCHLLAVETSAPHDVALLTLSPTLLDWADREISALLARVAACQDSGIWPGRYPDGGTLELPTWLIDDDLDIPEEGVGDVDDNLTAEDIIAMCKPKSDQLNAEDLLHGPIMAKVRGVKGNASPDGKQPLSVFLADRPHPWKPCVTMIRILSLAWGTDVAAWIGRSIRLYRDPEVRMGAQKVGGIRIAAMSNLPQTPFKAMLTVTRGKREEFAIAPLAAEAAPPKHTTRAPAEVPSWAVEGDASLTDEQLGEVMALLIARAVPLETVERALGGPGSWTAETVRTIIQRLNGGGR